MPYADPARRKEYSTEYRKKNREKNIVYFREYYRKNNK